MSKATGLQQVSVSLRGALDRRLIGGMFLGIAVMTSVMSVAQTSGTSSGWFSGLFSTGGTDSGSTSTTLISRQDSVVAAQINAEATQCAQGAHGTIGEAISTATNVHQQIASATPQVESLFDINSNCFSSTGQIFDLSFSIPSLGSILSAAESAMLQYAQKKKCTAVNQVTGMVTTPINLAINQINSLQGFTDINGMANAAVGNAMSQIDPNLGSQYHLPVTGGNYTTNTNPFNTSQTQFGTTGNTSGALNDNAAAINRLTQQIATQQIAVNNDTMALRNAQATYNSCTSGSSDSGCSAEFAALQAAQQQLFNDQQQLIALQTQLSQVITQSGAPTPTPAPAPVGPQAVAPGSTGSIQSAHSTSPSSSPSTSWWSSISNLLH